MLGPFATASRHTPHCHSPGVATVASHAACASMSTTTTTTTTTTTRDRGDRYGPMEWAQWSKVPLRSRRDRSVATLTVCVFKDPCTRRSTNQKSFAPSVRSFTVKILLRTAACGAVPCRTHANCTLIIRRSWTWNEFHSSAAVVVVDDVIDEVYIALAWTGTFSA